MQLLNYLKSLDLDAQKAFALRCETSVGQLKQVAYGYRRAGAGLAILIERESQGDVRCETLRPDIEWSYLRGTSKAA